MSTDHIANLDIGSDKNEIDNNEIESDESDNNEIDMSCHPHSIARRSECDENQKSTIETTLVTRSKHDGVRNEFCFKLRDTSIGLKGWKACAVETLGLGLMVAGVFFVAMHGKDAAKSVGDAVSNAITR